MKRYQDLYREAIASGASRFDARELLAHASAKSKTELVRDYIEYASEPEESSFAELLRRRNAGEPLAYIIGEWEFFGLPFRLTPSVLIPRPDSEPLVEAALRRLNSVLDRAQGRKILDICCGSGCLGLAVLANSENTYLTAVDISDAALEVTSENAKRLGLAERVTLVKCDVLQSPPELGNYDVIISNPPYVTAAEMEELERAVKDFEPSLALFGGIDGLDFYRSICSAWAKLLVPGGLMVLECAYAQGGAVSDLAKHIDTCNVIPTGSAGF